MEPQQTQTRTIGQQESNTREPQGTEESNDSGPLKKSLKDVLNDDASLELRETRRRTREEMKKCFNNPHPYRTMLFDLIKENPRPAIGIAAGLAATIGTAAYLVYHYYF